MSDVAEETSEQKYKKYTEEYMKEDVKYGNINTIKDIGYHLTERMKKSLEMVNANKDISHNPYSPPSIAFPGVNETSLYADPYDNILQDREEFYEGEENSELTARGDPRPAPEVNLSAPGLAMGESMVINPDFQFNELDDVRTDFRRPYIGRLYSERIYDYNLPKLIIIPGLVKLNLGMFSILGAITKERGTTADLASYLRDPDGAGLIKFTFQKIGAAFRGVLNFAVGGLLARKSFYEFVSSTRVYMRFVNEMLIEVSSWMDLGKSPIVDTQDWPDDRPQETGEGDPDKPTPEEIKLSTPVPPDKNGEMDEVYGLPQNEGYAGYSKTLSVLNILPGWKNARSEGGKQSFLEGIKDHAIETARMTAAVFLPFALSKGITVTETFSNTLEEHPLASELRSKGEQVQHNSLTAPLNDLGDAATIAKDLISDVTGGGDLGGSMINAAIKGAGILFRNVSTSMKKNGVLGEAGIILSGEGRFQLPNIWKGSSVSRSNSIELEFISPYGDKLCIFENTLVPLIFLLGLTGARQIGSSTYTSPFYIRAFSKGLFSCEVGMITSLTINRSQEKNERTQDGFSRSIRCSLEIQDALPNMMLSLDAGVFGILSSKNIGFREYIAMIANIDMIDRTAILNKYKVFMNAMTNKLSGENLLNEFKYGISQTLPFQLVLKGAINFFKFKPPQAVSGIQKPSNFQ
jgi:hypothetical protein